MRLKNVKGSREMIAASSSCIPEDEQKSWKGRWRDLFGNDHPLAIEIGMGKGQFLTALADRNPEINYLGIEKYSSVLIRAVQKREARQAEDPAALSNLRFLRMDAEDIRDIFAPGEVSKIYLNFSDPWPKDRHAKRRLPSRQYLARYSEILAPGGSVEFKTDNSGLFQFALDEASASGWTLDLVTWDLHADPVLSEGNIMTEYEEKFSERGCPIMKLVSRPGGSCSS